jgi:hypothetical protein
MNVLLRTLFVAAVVGLSLLSPAPRSAQADDYWTSHWNWYDNTYRPYYYRSYGYGPAYSYSGPGYYSPGYSGGYYGGGYYSPGYYGGYYGTPYRSYYGAPGVGYGRLYGGGSAINAGPLSFGWR